MGITLCGVAVCDGRTIFRKLVPRRELHGFFRERKTAPSFAAVILSEFDRSLADDQASRRTPAGCSAAISVVGDREQTLAKTSVAASDQLIGVLRLRSCFAFAKQLLRSG